MIDRTARPERYPRLTGRRHWGSYALGMATEVAFILGLALVGLLLALLGSAIWR